MNVQTSLPSQMPSPAGALRPQTKGRLLLAAIFLVATVLAFVLVYVTDDRSLVPEQRRARGEIRKLEGLFKAHNRLMGRFPSKEQGFTPLIEAKLIDSVPLDPWGHPYVYWMDGRNGAVISYGADGKKGGVGTDADLSSGGVLTDWGQP
ncbi:type II secretion system protein GspG [Myxococcus sp. CA051A]|uniref:General secretion pathway protein GspG n=2 Tax=Myxococcus TaxID=32 RepID=A0A540WZQ7_9BACT|nr:MULTISPECIES: type II secretion system protein GspG [Myxococcus]NTX13153.1 type II secretion system protein GspG [Myxococcus sp. CA056]NTX36396.1 type II secretion system protein GspG [Myxococcus sp. CA033]NTX04227.1 type II secretion system protein GspG [Myxococcus sp. CA040A]NTX50985.1 type II secretion system protein GspG [Myxococcus sp. CA039A]NTX64704.1 type II secretion system protein GspG [Myxococcus sp. CA051A]